MRRISLSLLLVFCCTGMFCQLKTQLIKKEIVNNDTVEWIKYMPDGRLSAYIKDQKEELKDCLKLGDLKDSERVRYRKDNYFKSEFFLKQQDSLISVLLMALPLEAISILMESKEKTPIVAHNTINSEGQIFYTAISVKSDCEDVLTLDNVYAMCHSIQSRIIFDKPSNYDLDCFSFSIPIKKEVIIAKCKLLNLISK